MPEATGEIKVAAKAGATNIDVKIKEMTQPSKLGAEFLTYVLWVVTPDGRTGNTGEILINENGEGKLNATTPGQTFAMIVTAEPYFAVRTPARWWSWKTTLGKIRKGKIFPVNDFKLMRRAQLREAREPSGNDAGYRACSTASL